MIKKEKNDIVVRKLKAEIEKVKIKRRIKVEKCGVKKRGEKMSLGWGKTIKKFELMGKFCGLWEKSQFIFLVV